jgi:hypothetical protein
MANVRTYSLHFSRWIGVDTRRPTVEHLHLQIARWDGANWIPECMTDLDGLASQIISRNKAGARALALFR